MMEEGYNELEAMVVRALASGRLSGMKALNLQPEVFERKKKGLDWTLRKTYEAISSYGYWKALRDKLEANEAPKAAIREAARKTSYWYMVLRRLRLSEDEEARVIAYKESLGITGDAPEEHQEYECSDDEKEYIRSVLRSHKPTGGFQAWRDNRE